VSDYLNALAASGLPSVTGRTFANPVLYADGEQRTNPDPFVLRFRGRYYCYSTGEQQMHVSSSRDLVTWEYLGAALLVAGRSHYWAPCVVYADGTFYMYFSNRPTDSIDPHDEVLQLAVSSSPEGPFEVVHRFFDTFSIDPHVVRDSMGYVLFYSTNDVTGLDDEFTGTTIVADRLLAFDRLEGRPRRVVTPSIDQEIFERNRFGDGRDWYTVEGASYFTHHDNAFMTYSGNAYVRQDYFIGYARATRAPDILQLDWQKYPSDVEYSPLVRRSADVEGTGHNSTVRAPNLVDEWMVYHGRDARQPLLPDIEQRVMRIDPLFFSGDRVVTAAPSAGVQDAPFLPTVTDGFGGQAVGPSWQCISGKVEARDGILVTPAAHRTLAVHEHDVENYVAEVFLCAEPTDAGARAGMVVHYRDPGNHTEVYLDRATGSIAAVQSHNGIEHEVARAPIGAIDFTAWHRLELRRTFTDVDVLLDDLAVLRFAVPEGAGMVGLAAFRTAANFSAYSLTEHTSLYGDSLVHLPRMLAAQPAARLTGQGIGGIGRRTVTLVGEAGRTGVVTTYGLDLPTSEAVVEVHPSYIDAENHVRVRVDPHTYLIEQVRGGRITHSIKEEKEDRAGVSLRALFLNDTALVQIDDRAHHFTHPDESRFGQRIALASAHLRSFEQTTVLPQTTATRLAKDQA
jgi:GH43 family beta-xylosidase